MAVNFFRNSAKDMNFLDGGDGVRGGQSAPRADVVALFFISQFRPRFTGGSASLKMNLVHFFLLGGDRDFWLFDSINFFGSKSACCNGEMPSGGVISREIEPAFSAFMSESIVVAVSLVAIS